VRAADVAAAAANAPIELRPAASSAMITRKEPGVAGSSVQWDGVSIERRLRGAQAKGATRLVSRESASVRIS